MKKPHFTQAAGLRCNGQQKLALHVKSADAANEDRGPAVREPQGDHTDLPGLPRALPPGRAGAKRLRGQDFLPSIADLPVFEHTFWKKEQELSGKDGLSKK